MTSDTLGAAERCRTSLGRRVLMLPLPFQGHINPMLRLAGVLHSRGFSVTVLYTQFNAPNPARHPGLRFVAVDPDGASERIAGSTELIDLILALNYGLHEAFRERLEAEKSVAGEEDDPVACLVIDAHWLSMQAVATELGVPTLVLRSGAALCFKIILAHTMLREKGYLPVQESMLDMPVPELPPFRVKDLLTSRTSTDESFNRLVLRAVEAARSTSGVIFNTFDSLESDELESMRLQLGVPVFAIGPLHILAPENDGSLLKQDRSCLDWLDSQPPRSVLYVSFGSLAAVKAAEFTEVAWGIAGSGQPFVWVIRPGLVDGLKRVDLPDGFVAATAGKGIIVEWAPQQEVLRHPAVGAFWTHCGWNSTLESICEGMPMLCRPFDLDQMANARYVDHVWKVGFELRGKLERGDVEAGIRRLMSGDEAVKARGRASELKAMAAQAVSEGGSSNVAVGRLVDHVMALAL